MVYIIMDSESEAYTSFVKDDFCDNLEKVAQSFLPEGISELHVSSDVDESDNDFYPLEDGELEEGELEECEVQCDENEKENEEVVEENVKSETCEDEKAANMEGDEKTSEADKTAAKPDRPVNSNRSGKRKRHTRLKHGKSKRLNERINWKVTDEKQADEDEEMFGLTWPPRIEDLIRSSEEGDEDEMDEAEEGGDSDESGLRANRKKSLLNTEGAPEFGGFVERRSDRPRAPKNEKRKPSKRRTEKSRKFLELRRMRESARDRNSYLRDKSMRREPPVCKFYVEGRCNKGDECPFSHDFQPAKKPELCKYYLNGYCAKNEVCNFMHSEFPCKFFHTGTKECLHGPRCRFSHEPIGEDVKNAFEKHLRDLDEQPKRPSLLGSPPRSLKEQNEKLAECRKTTVPIGTANTQQATGQQIPSLMDIHLDTNNQNSTPQTPCSQPFYQDSLFNYDEQKQQQQQQQQQHTENGFSSNNQQRATPPRQHAQTSPNLPIPPPHPGMMPIPPPNMMMHNNLPPIHRPPPNILSPVGPPPRWNEHHPRAPFFYANVPPGVMPMPNVGQMNSNIMHFTPMRPPPNIGAIRNELDACHNVDDRGRPDIITIPHQPRLPPPPVSLAMPGEWRMPVMPLPSQAIQPNQSQQQQQCISQPSGDGNATGKRTLQDLINAISRNYSSPPAEKENDTNENLPFKQSGQFVEFMKAFDKIQTDSQSAFEESVKSRKESCCAEINGNGGSFNYQLIPLLLQNKSYPLPEPVDPLDPRISVYKKKMENIQVEEEERQRVEILKVYSSVISTGNQPKKSADPRIKDPRLKPPNSNAEEAASSSKPCDPRRSRQLSETKPMVSSDSVVRCNIPINDSMPTSLSVGLDDPSVSMNISSPPPVSSSHLKISFADYFQRKNRTSSSVSSDTTQNNESNVSKML